MRGESPQAAPQRRASVPEGACHHAHMEPAIRVGNVSSRLGAGGCPLRQFSILAGATLCVSPARPTRGSVPSTPERSTFPSGFADRSLSPGWTTHLPWPAVPGSVRRSHGALRFRIGRGRSGQSDPLMAARMAFPQGISGAGATPEAVASCENTLAATPHRPSARGVAPAPARTARPAAGGRTAEPQGVAFPADGWQGPCESRERQSVNRPPASASRSSTA